MFHEQLSDSKKDPAEAAEWEGQVALVHTTLEFLLTQRCFKATTIRLFKAVVFEQESPAAAAQAFNTSVGNVYEAKRAVLVKLKAMLRALDQGLGLEEAFTNIDQFLT
jgi:hypothetical protein